MRHIIKAVIILTLIINSSIAYSKDDCAKPKILSIEVEKKLQDIVYLDIDLCGTANKTYIVNSKLILLGESFKETSIELKLAASEKLETYQILRPVEKEESFTTNYFAMEFTELGTEKRAIATYPLRIEWPAINDIKDPSIPFLKNLYEHIVYLNNYNSSESYKKAKRLIDYSLARNPNFVDTYHELARYLMKTQGFGTSSSGVMQAEQVLLTAKEIDPEHANTRVLLGYVYSWQNRFDESLQELERAKEIGTDNLWLYTNWGEMYERKGEPDKAIYYYKKAIEGPRPKNSYYRGMLFAYKYLSSLYIDQKMYEEASELNKEASGRFREKECFKAQMQLVDALYLDKYQEVLNDLELNTYKYCKNTYKEIKTVANLRMWNYLVSKGEDTAEAYYRKATVINPDYVDLLATVAKYQFSIDEGVLENLNKNKRGLDITDSDNKSALISTILTNDRNAAERLIKGGAYVNNVYTDQKVTALIIAVAYNNLEMVKLLVNNGADINHKLVNGLTALDIARSNNYAEIVEFLSSSRIT